MRCSDLVKRSLFIFAVALVFSSCRGVDAAVERSRPSVTGAGAARLPRAQPERRLPKKRPNVCRKCHLPKNYHRCRLNKCPTPASRLPNRRSRNRSKKAYLLCFRNTVATVGKPVPDVAAVGEGPDGATWWYWQTPSKVPSSSKAGSRLKVTAVAWREKNGKRYELRCSTYVTVKSCIGAGNQGCAALGRGCCSGLTCKEGSGKGKKKQCVKNESA